MPTTDKDEQDAVTPENASRGKIATCSTCGYVFYTNDPGCIVGSASDLPLCSMCNKALLEKEE